MKRCGYYFDLGWKPSIESASSAGVLRFAHNLRNSSGFSSCSLPQDIVESDRLAAISSSAARSRKRLLDFACSSHMCCVVLARASACHAKKAARLNRTQIIKSAATMLPCQRPKRTPVIATGKMPDHLIFILPSFCATRSAFPRTTGPRSYKFIRLIPLDEVEMPAKVQ